MRALAAATLLLFGGCGAQEQSNTAPPPEAAAPTADRNEAPSVEALPANRATPAEPPEIPGVADMSPYRRREYERGFRDCRAGRFDPARQGESYRIGCMAAQEASDRSE